MMTYAAVTFTASLPTLLIAHHAGDHWVQTSHQARGKAARGGSGAWCCAKNVAGYTMTTSALLGLVVVVGKRGYYEHGGAYELDQSFHRFWLLAAALLTALV